MNKIKNFLIKREQSQACLSFAKREKSRLLAKTILTLVALLAVTTGAWAETGENIFQYCYDCQRSPAYPKTTASASLSGFENPLVGYKGSGFGMGNTPAGPWKLEYMGIWSTTNQYGIDNVSIYQSTYNCTDVPVFRLYQWNATANEYQHAAYGVVCCYAKVSNAVEHTALFVSEDGWGCVLTNSSHTSSMNITFDEDLSTGLATLIAAATPNASSGSTVEVDWNKTSKTGTFKMPGGNVELEPEYYPQAALTVAPTAINDVPATTDGAIVNAGTVKNIGETATAQGTVMYYVSTTALDDAALLALAADAWKADVPTAQSLAAGPAYVYYYVRGNDSDTDDEIFSDGDILASNALTVTIAAEPTYAVTFKAANANTIEAGKATVTVGGTAATVTEGKLEGVKMGSEVKIKANTGYKFRKVEVKKKAEVLTITVAKGSTDLSGDKLLYYTPGETYRQAIANHPENKLDGGLGWNIWDGGSDATIFYKESADKARDLSIDGDQHFRPTDSINLDTVIDPTLNFFFVAQF